MTRCSAFAAEIADRVAAPHGAGILRRDLKPGNVILTDAGRTVVVDFGAAKEVEDAAETTMGQVVGTVVYMAPEDRPENGCGRSGRGRRGAFRRSLVKGVGTGLATMLPHRMPFQFAASVESGARLLAPFVAAPMRRSNNLPEAVRALREQMDRVARRDASVCNVRSD